MSKGEQLHTMSPPEVEATPPVYAQMPQVAPHPGPQTNTKGGEYPMQPVHAPSGYPSPQQTSATPIAGSTPGQMDPAMAAAIAGQQYRDQLLAECAAGRHERVTNYGIGGIIAAVLCFPCGLICLFADTQDRCARCNVVLS